jgi:uncharacterized protein
MKRKNLIILLMTFCIVTVLPATQSRAKTVPALTGRVIDNASMLSASTINQLETFLADFEKEESTQIVVLTVDSLEGENLEEFSLKVAETWQLGRKDIDNGILLLIAKKERKIRIEVGYGLEGSLTDLIAGRIIRDIITPKFKSGNFDQGIIDGIAAITATVKGEFDTSASTATGKKNSNDFSGFLFFILFAFFNLGRMFQKKRGLTVGIGAILAPLLTYLFFGPGLYLLALIPVGGFLGYLAATPGSPSRAGHSSGWSRGSGGSFGGFGGSGGGFSGGGGGFGGGGSSGGW